ncbi:2-amino-4-hydroxy-6-hydroxymethyldihydropteridine diphosphokinase [bacterium]|nr:2-amino-4-hydroxy-6-hydroxymethyldihydropteridine diphosphokinase [bacterium]
MISIIGLGSDQGDRLAEMRLALDALSRWGTGMMWSRVFRGPARGNGPMNEFLNAVLWLECPLEAPELLARLLAHETARGRTRMEGMYTSRPIDLDLLYYGDHCIDLPGLIVPHPRRLERRFVLEPLAEICPNWVDPVTGQTVGTCLDLCPDRAPLVPLTEGL